MYQTIVISSKVEKKVNQSGCNNGRNTSEGICKMQQNKNATVKQRVRAEKRMGAVLGTLVVSSMDGIRPNENVL